MQTARLVADRYRLEVQLGRDGDVVQWLGADTLLERPVLVRILDRQASPARRAEFLAGVQAAARVSHIHLSAVYAAHADPEGDYAVQEWSGGISLADRLHAGDLLDAGDVVRNGAGLAEALAALHAAGGRHGAIDAAAIMYPAAQPAKLDGFGRAGIAGGGAPPSPARDVAALAGVLSRAMGADDSGTGARPGLPAPAAQAIAAARTGTSDAAALAAGLSSAPTGPGRRPGKEWSWTWVAAAAAILAVATLVAVVGLALRVQPSTSPLLFPAPAAPSPQPTTPPPPSTAPDRPPATAAPADDPPQLTAAAAYDPFGTGGERDADIPLLHDGDMTTGWRTERYFDPLERLKPGVGVTFEMSGTPRSLSLAASAGAAFRVGWAPAPPTDFTGWEFVANGQTGDDPADLSLPPRPGGVWLLWLTELPSQPPDGHFFAHVYEVRFEG